jgi:hypothetical protein
MEANKAGGLFMKSMRWLPILLLGCILLGCSRGGTYRLYLRYDPAKDFPALQEKIGMNLAVPPFKDERFDTRNIGYLAPLAGSYIYYRSEPFPLERAIRDSLSDLLSPRGIKTVPVPGWNGQPDSLKGLQADSILMVEIKKFWIEGNATLLGTDIKASVSLVIQLGVKKEGKVFTRSIDLERNMKDIRLSPPQAQKILNQMITEIFDNYFSNPY